MSIATNGARPAPGFGHEDLAGYLGLGDTSAGAPAVVSTVSLQPGAFHPRELLRLGSNSFGALIMDGLVAQEVAVGGNPTLLLLGTGDAVLATDLGGDVLCTEQAWAAWTSSRIALMDDRLLHATRLRPRLMPVLLERVAETRGRTILQLVISHQTKVEDRLLGIFGMLAERFGRVTPDGIVIPLPLTHETLGRMIGARRPTVTLAARALDEAGRLGRRRDRSWILRQAPEQPADSARIRWEQRVGTLRHAF
jgi:hypothetical protein